MDWLQRLGVTPHARELYAGAVLTKTPLPCRALDEALYDARRDRLLRQYQTVHCDGFDDLYAPVVRIAMLKYDHDADAFWAFAMIRGLQRPYRPVHGEQLFQKQADRAYNAIRLRLCILDDDLWRTLRTTLRSVIPAMLRRWHGTWFAAIGATTPTYDKLLATRAKKRADVLHAIAAHIIHAAAEDLPRAIGSRDAIYAAIFAYRITDEEDLLRRAVP